MKILSFLNQLGIGGSEKAAFRWAQGLTERGHVVQVLSLADGTRRVDFEAIGIEVRVVDASANSIRKHLRDFGPDVIHIHAPGHPHEGDALGEALSLMPYKIPAVQTNIFGRLENPKENAWTDFRLFISWTSGVQAARRSFRRLDGDFFKKASVAVYPVDPDDGPSLSEVQDFRRAYSIKDTEILFGRISRPEPNKWSDLPIHAFRIAARQNPRIKLLLREPPPSVARALKDAADHERFVILSATSDGAEIARTIGSLDAVLHTSSVGESFGYGIAEPMNYGKPIIANSTPWQDQAQIELVRQRECGIIASTPKTIANAILALAENGDMRAKFGCRSKSHIRELADPAKSTGRLEQALQIAISGIANPNATEDLARAREAASYLDQQQFGQSWSEQLALRPLYYRVRFHQWRQAFRLHSANNRDM